MLNQLRGSYTQIKFLFCIFIYKVVIGKILFFVIGPFCTFCSAFDRAVLYGNVVFSIVILSTKNKYSRFLQKDFHFQKTFVKIKVLKTFKICGDFHIKIREPLRQSSFLQIFSTICLQSLNLC